MKPFYWITRFVIKCLAWLFYRHKVYGLEHFIPGAAILAPNHSSFLDPPLVGISSPEEIAYLARASLFHGKFLGFLLRHLNTYPVEGTTSDLASFKMIFQLLRDKQKVVVFPEGFRTHNGDMSPLKGGIGMLALRSQCPIIPVYIDGSYAIWKRHQRYPKVSGRTTVVFGTPIYSAQFDHLPKKEAQIAIANRVYTSIEGLRAWYQQGAKGLPP